MGKTEGTDLLVEEKQMLKLNKNLHQTVRAAHYYSPFLQ